ncbi:hypothetical protein [Lysinibacillus sp. ZYM-1]|uniref:hypothetical protein n=1 Tax=Lysinibacillus sp. ZYM-1 TaxID=1681184 RepID=UPI000AA740AA|nr:hypothetical protein [Lysinibacillus sp. ZYM-1]
MQEAIRRSKNIKRVAKYERKLLNVQMHVERVTGDREVQVLNWMLDGKSQRWIGQHMAFSANSIKRIKDKMRGFRASLKDIVEESEAMETVKPWSFTKDYEANEIVSNTIVDSKRIQ